MYNLTLDINSLPLTPNKLLGAHWSTRRGNASTFKTLLFWKVVKLRPTHPLETAKLKLTRHSSSEPDYDNLVGSFKPVIDALVSCDILVNDKPENITTSYHWSYAAPKKGKITIEVNGA